MTNDEYQQVNVDRILAVLADLTPLDDHVNERNDAWHSEHQQHEQTAQRERLFEVRSKTGAVLGTALGAVAKDALAAVVAGFSDDEHPLLDFVVRRERVISNRRSISNNIILTAPAIFNGRIRENVLIHARCNLLAIKHY